MGGRTERKHYMTVFIEQQEVVTNKFEALTQKSFFFCRFATSSHTQTIIVTDEIVIYVTVSLEH